MQASVYICLSIALTVSASPRDNASESFNEARHLYYSGIDGNEHASKQSCKLFEELAQAHPDNPLIMAYFGSTKLLESSRTLAIWRKGKLAKEGLTALDRAVAAAPDNLEIRFVRAATTYHLPGLFKREQQSRQDFEFLAIRAENAASSGTLTPRLAAAALLYHGMHLERSNESDAARKAWAAALRLAPDTPAGREASKRLN